MSRQLIGGGPPETAHGYWRTAIALVVAAALIAGARTEIRSAGAAPGQEARERMAELWVEPGPDRDLRWGVGGKRLAPDPAARYKVIEIKRGGFSRGYTVKDSADREWSVKFPPEAAPEVAASRLLWGVGYHQPPVYYLPEWQADEATSPNPQLPARFRESKPDLHGLDNEGTWSYYDNPFVGTPQMNGLLVLQAMLGNSDLKDEQNALYELSEPFEGARRWYVARDLGQSFGRTGMLDPPRGDIDVFEKTPFIRGVENGYVRFEYSGRHKSLFERITPADVRWICRRLQALSDRQMRDAFRAAGYPEVIVTRYVRRLEQKIAEGLALEERSSSR